MPPAIRDQLAARGYLDASMPVCRATERLWLARDPFGGIRELWHQRSQVLTCNWALLWQQLRSRVPDDKYRRGSEVTALRPEGAGVLVRTTGCEERHALVVGADGYHSLVRKLVAPASRLQYAGYSLWRASVPLDRLTDAKRTEEDLTGRYLTIGFPGGHAILYLVPQSAALPGRTRLNWALYAAPPAGADFDAELHYPTGRTTGIMRDHVHALAREFFPDRWQEAILVADEQEMAVQPVRDLTLATTAAYPLLLAGDAGTITRPHTASGAVKALEDALLLEDLLTSGLPLTEALRSYGTLRANAGNLLVEVGRAIGRDQVESTPYWHEMTVERMEEWANGTLDGYVHYLYENASEQT